MDVEAAVRRQAASLFRRRIFPGLPGGALQPFLPLIMAYVHSGLTQLAADVRCCLPPAHGLRRGLQQRLGPLGCGHWAP